MSRFRSIDFLACSAVAIAVPAAVQAQPLPISIKESALGSALTALAVQTRLQFLYSPDLVRDKRSPAVSGMMEPEQALRMLLEGSRLTFRRTQANAYLIEASHPASPAADPATYGQADAPAAVAEDASIGDIVVTAQRRSERLQEVPIAITAVTSARLAASNVTTTAALLNVTPALTFSNVNGYLQPRLRGVGNSSSGAAVENSIATYVDGVYISSATGALLDLNNIERVEILKGPQGTLFGRNATGGLIQVVTRDPASTFSGNATIGYGNYETVRGNAYVTGPITDTLAADLAVSGTHQGKGFGRNLVIGGDANRLMHDATIRSKFMWKPGTSTTVRLALDYNNNLSSYPTINLLPGAASPDYRDAAGVPIRVPHGPWDVVTNRNARQSLKAFGTSLNIQQDIGDLTLTSISAFRRTISDKTFDSDYSPATANVIHFRQSDRQYSQELQLASNNGPLKWVAGLYYFRLDSAYAPFETFIGQPITRINTLRDDLKNESFAAYAQGTYELLPRTNLTLGLRYTTERRTIVGSITALTTATGATTVTPIPSDGFRRNIATWRIALDHKFADDVMGYVSWNRGFKSGGFNSSAPTTPSYQPERLDAYEVGLKSQLFDRTLLFNAAAFYYDYKDVQVNSLLGAIGIIYNGAAARVYGLDVDGELRLSSDLSFTFGMTLLDDKFTSFPAAVIGMLRPDGTYSTSLGSAAGNRLPFAPDATIAAGLLYRTRIADGETQFALNEVFNSGYRTQADNVLRQGSFHMLGASAAWTDPAGTFTVRAFVNNLANEAVRGYAVISNKAAGTYLPPRTYGGSISVRF